MTRGTEHSTMPVGAMTAMILDVVADVLGDTSEAAVPC